MAHCTWWDNSFENIALIFPTMPVLLAVCPLACISPPTPRGREIIKNKRT